MTKRTYLRDKLKQILGLGFAAGDQGVIETVETNRETLEEIRAAMGLPPEATPAKVLGAVKDLKASLEEMRSQRK